MPLQPSATVEVGGSPMEIRLQGPQRDKPGPAVVLMYHRDGFDAFTDKVMGKLSDGGYLVATPDVSHRVSRDIRMADRKQYFKDSEVVADIAATLDHLATRADVNQGRIALMGHCMGGRMTMLGAGALDRFRGAIVLYGGGVHLSWGNEGWTPLERLGNIKCPLVGFFGSLDNNPSPEQVDRMEAALAKAKVPHVFHRYGDAGHGFQNREPGTPGEQAAAADSWAKIFRFLAETCGA